WAVGNSFKDVVSTFSAGAFIPFVDYQPSLASWESVLGSPNALLALMNSFIASIGATIMVIILGTPAAYSLARFEFKIPSRDISIWFLSQRVLPPAVVLVPFFVVMVNLKLIDTRLALILVYTTFNLPFGVLIMRDIFRDISQDIEDAARIDGATEWQVFYRIALPLSVNGLITTGIIVFAFSWNEALFAATLTSREAATLPVYILSSRSTRGVDFNIAAVNTLLAIVPPVVMSLFVQRYLARGLSFGAVKG
ncbi:MAG TPA: carbohydrate ABC transporter permease, partial [Gammaproteobacteria bacterium]|nr:carbohydrate ABC transporter permease [Gammaproteobacteria bacterium]